MWLPWERMLSEGRGAPSWCTAGPRPPPCCSFTQEGQVLEKHKFHHEKPTRMASFKPDNSHQALSTPIYTVAVGLLCSTCRGAPIFRQELVPVAFAPLSCHVAGSLQSPATESGKLGAPQTCLTEHWPAVWDSSQRELLEFTL